MARFELTPAVVVTLDRRVVTGAAMPLIFPGPLVPPLAERQLTPAGWARIVGTAQDAGLLRGVTTFGVIAPGQAVVRVRLVADARPHEITAPNGTFSCFTEPCQGAPGTPEAVLWFASQLNSLDQWLGAELGEQAAHAPEGYAIVVGGVPSSEGLPQPSMDWPLEGGFAAFGKPFADGSGFRCGTLTGANAERIRHALTGAKENTKWRDPVDGSFHGLTVRPLLPGDYDLCAGLV